MEDGDSQVLGGGQPVANAVGIKGEGIGKEGAAASGGRRVRVQLRRKKIEQE
jgi:hypothetical protein